MKLLFVKSAIVLTVALGCLTGCKRDDAAPIPTISVAFAKQVALRGQQSGAFPSRQAPELTITVDAINDSRCPEDVTCAWGGVAETVLAVRSENGVSQVLTLSLPGLSTQQDSAVVQANGRQYLVVLHAVTPYPKAIDPGIQLPKKAVLSVQRQ